MPRRPPRVLVVASSIVLAVVVALWVRSYGEADVLPLGGIVGGVGGWPEWELASEAGRIVLRNDPAIAAAAVELAAHRAALAGDAEEAARPARLMDEYDEEIDAALRGEGPFPVPRGPPPAPPTPPPRPAPAPAPPPALYAIHHAALAAPLAAATLALAVQRLRPGPRPGHCRRCGYDLTGNVSGRCPECGTDVPRDGGRP